VSEFGNACWLVFQELFKALYAGGYIGCGVALLVSGILSRWGAQLTGRPPTYTVWVSLFKTEVWTTPAIQGSAQSRFGRIIGYLMQFTGGLLMFIAVFALLAVIWVDIAKRHP
jgi:hypothetical protein